MRDAALSSVIVLRIQEFAGKPVTEQVRLKAQLEALVALAIRTVPAGNRIVLDAPDGAAIVVLDGPKAALDIAQRSQAAGVDLPLLIGVNHGPVRAAFDARGGSALVGDGLAAAMTLSGVATPDRLMASRSFHEALEVSAPGRAAELTTAGTFTDGSVRSHELFTLDERTTAARRRRLITASAGAIALILGLGIAGRILMRPRPPAIVGFEIAPRGEIFIDGVLKGSAPALKRIEVAPGAHTVEVRNPPFPPLRVEINVAAAEELTITHTFAKSGPKGGEKKGGAKSGGKGFKDYWRDLRQQMGL
jgi:hypothetical protein